MRLINESGESVEWEVRRTTVETTLFDGDVRFSDHITGFLLNIAPLSKAQLWITIPFHDCLSPIANGLYRATRLSYIRAGARPSQ